MSEAGAGARRPLCRCHGRPMLRVGGRNANGWRCAAKDSYRRGRSALRKRIAQKHALLDQLEPHAQEDV